MVQPGDSRVGEWLRGFAAVWLCGLVLCLVPAALRAQQPAEVPEEESPDLATEDATLELEPVTVSARQGGREATVTVVDKEDVEARGAQSLDQALELVPGVDVNHHPKSGGKLLVRGFDERNVRLLVDGIPLKESYDGHFEFGSVAAPLVSSIAVERGVTSVLHGPNSAGGVVLVRTDREFGAGYGEAGVSGGNWHDHRLLDVGADLAVGHEWGDVGKGGAVAVAGTAVWQYSGGSVLSQDYRATAQNASFHEEGGLRDGSGHERLAAAVRGSWQVADRLRISAVAIGLNQEREIPPFESSGYVRYWSYSEYMTGLGGLTVEWRGRRNGYWSLRKVQASTWGGLHRDTLTDHEDAHYDALTTNPLAWFAKSSYDNSTFGAAVSPTFGLWSANTLSLVAGVDRDSHAERTLPIANEAGASAWSAWDRYGALVVNVAAEDTQRLGPVRLGAGIGASGLFLEAQELNGKSYAADERMLHSIDARLTAEVRPVRRLRLLAAAGRKTRYPTLKELYSNAVGGNAELAAEESWMAEVGVDLEGWPVSWMRFEVRLFGNLLEDLIERPTDRYENVAEARTAGVEVGFRMRPFPVLEVGGWYTLLETRDLETGRALDYRSKHSGALDVRVRPWRGGRIAVQGLVRSGQESWFFESVGAEWQHDRLPAFLLVNARLSQQVTLAPAWYLEAWVSARNLLDADMVTGSFDPQPGRSVLAGVDMAF